MLPGERKYLELIYKLTGVCYKVQPPKILLTFDDGPVNGLTGAIGETLEKSNIKGVFFILTRQVTDWEIIRDLQQAGHSIGLHGHTHLPVNINPQIFDEWALGIKLMQDHGIEPVALRPPYGLYNENFVDFASQLNLPILMWNHTTYDYKAENTEQWIKKVSKQTQEGDIMLLHDSDMTKSIYPNALEVLLKQLQEEGFKFASFSEVVSL